jgi:hypothetical protein
MTDWVYLLTAFACWFSAGLIAGARLTYWRVLNTSLGSAPGIATPGAGASDPAPGVAPNP